MADSPRTSVEDFTVHVLWHPTEQVFSAFTVWRNGPKDSAGDLHVIQPTPDPTVIYEDIAEEIGMWMTNLVERLREAVTLF